MTTSGTYTFSVNRDQIIRMAMINIGKLDEIETPSSQDITDCSMFLNMLVKQWQGKADFAPGLKTWTRRHGHLFLSASTGRYTVGPSSTTGWTNSYTQTSITANAAAGQAVIIVASNSGMATGGFLGFEDSTGALAWGTILTIVGTTITLTANLSNSVTANAVAFYYLTVAQQPIDIETAFLRDQFNNDVPINVMTVQQYDVLPSKTNTTYVSDPTAIYYEFQLTDGVLYTDVAASQDVTKHIAMTYMEAIQDFSNPADTPEYPQEWYLPLTLGLSKLIAPMYNRPWSALQESNAVMALKIAQKKEPDMNTMFFQSGDPDW